MLTSIREKTDLWCEAIPFVVGVPIAFVLICWGDFSDRIDGMVWKIRQRADRGR